MSRARFLSRIRSRAAAQEGFSMIELVIAIFIIVIVIGALTMGFVNASDSSLSSQREISAFSVLQQQLERVRGVVKANGFSALALTSSPTALCSTSTVDPTSPNAFVCGSGCSETFAVESNYNFTSESFPSSVGVGVADSPESLLVNGCTVSTNAISGGQLAPVQYVDLSNGSTYPSLAALQAADSLIVSGQNQYATIYTYAMQTTTAGCNTNLTGSGTGSGTSSCNGDLRRVVIAAVMSAAAADIGTNYPTYASTVFANPIASNQSNTASGLKILGFIS